MVTFRDISYRLSDFSDVSEIIPFIGWAAFAKKGLPYSILGIFFFLSGIIKIFTLVTADVSVNNLPAYHLLAFLEIAAVCSFYNQLIFQKVNPWMLVGLVLLYAANSIFIQPVFTFNSLAWVCNMFFIIIIGLGYFLRIYQNEEDTRPLDKRPDFIMTAGWLIYAAGSLFPYLMVTDIFTGKAQAFFDNGWVIQNISNILKNIIICYGFWLTKK